MGRQRRRGGLSDDDRALWAQVARSITPLDQTVRHSAPAAAEQPDARRSAGHPAAGAFVAPAVTPPPAPAPPPPAFRVGAAAHLSKTPLPAPQTPAERLRARPMQMDARTHRDLTRGKLRPEARIDLHGLTLAVAKVALAGFILSAQASGRRLVLVITGKGKGDDGPLPTRAGALRHEVPHWLHMAPVAAAVMQVVPAHLRHGGSGAYYVYLRRPGRG